MMVRSLKDVNTLEGQIFSWETYQALEELHGCEDVLEFYNVVLKIPVGDFVAGTKFSSARVDFRGSQLRLSNEDNDFDFSLKLSIGDKPTTLGCSCGRKY